MVHGVAKSRTRLSSFTLTFHFSALEKEMATHSSIIACRVPGTGEPGGLLSMGSHRVGHDSSDLAAAAIDLNPLVKRILLIGLPIKNRLLFAQTHVHWVGDAIQPSHSLSPSSPPALNLSQHQSLFQ